MAWSGGKRTLVGCAIGCGVLVVVAVALVVGFGLWLNAPGEVLEPERLLGADTTGFVELRLSLDDPETAAFVDGLIGGLQSIAPEDVARLPPPVDGWLRAGREAKTRRDVERLFPAVAAWTLRPGARAGDDGRPDELHLFSVSLERASHQLILADFVLGLAFGRDEQTSKHRHLDETIYQARIDASSTVTAFIDSGILFVTSDLETAKQAVERLRRPADASAPATPLDRIFDGVPRDRPLRGAISNAGGEARRLWNRLAADGGAATDDTMWSAVRGLALSAELDAEGGLVGFVELVTDDPARAATDLDAWRRAFEATLPADLGPVEIDARTVDGRARIGLRVPRVLERFVPGAQGNERTKAATSSAARSR